MSRGEKQPHSLGAATVSDVTFQQGTPLGGVLVKQREVYARRSVTSGRRLQRGDEDDLAVVEELAGEQRVVKMVRVRGQLAHLDGFPAVDEVVGCKQQEKQRTLP